MLRAEEVEAMQLKCSAAVNYLRMLAKVPIDSIVSFQQLPLICGIV